MSDFILYLTIMSFNLHELHNFIDNFFKII
jgi:hypothetical protein